MAVQYAFGKIITQGLDLNVDAADPTSYPGTGTSWTSVVNRSITGSLVSCSFSSDFKGGIVFNNPSASVIFPGTVANYGTGSFTIEMAFRPSHIEGIHYLVSKNSGSFPNWGVYLSGSGGSGKLWATYNISAAISCSVSSSTTFVTGSIYFIDIPFYPLLSASAIYVSGEVEASSIGNNGGSLATTASLFVGALSTNSPQNFLGSIYNLKTYINNFPLSLFNNFASTATRFSKPITPPNPFTLEVLTVAGGGGGGSFRGGGGGAGGLQYITSFPITSQTTNITVGDGGLANINGQNSIFGAVVSIGGGKGGYNNTTNPAGDGGSGGGGFLSGVSGIPGGLGTTGQGNNGGQSGGASKYSAGGGGGAGTVGQDGSGTARAGNGGAGSYIEAFSTIGGSTAGWFAGGGGGGGNSGDFGFGGIGGGGQGANFGGPGIAGIVNTGGGGGGGGQSSGVGGKGGSGIVAVKYQGSPVAVGGEITQSAGFTYHVFRTVGTSSFTIF
jgi:hypothetical protein